MLKKDLRHSSFTVVMQKRKKRKFASPVLNVLSHTVQTINTSQHLLIHSQLQFLYARGEGVQLYSMSINRRVRIRLSMKHCRAKQFAKSLTFLYDEQLVMRAAESETFLNLAPALHGWKG
jgi:plasmid maintenance system killer protein